MYRFTGLHKPQLDDYLKKYATQNHELNYGVSWGLHLQSSDQIIGYYTICTASVNIKDFPKEYQKGFPRYPMPCMLLAKLAVDINLQGNGYGDYLIYDCLKRIKLLSESIGSHALIVDALDDEATNFYQKYGFKLFKDSKLKLYFPIGSIPDN
jgi:ribosomal protein S18 acetylase RimI-like enzyme